MSLKKTKEQMLYMLGDSNNQVVALSGKWGTGKTHLWDEVKRNSTEANVQNSLYVSLFGLSSIDQMKRKLIEASIPVIESHGGVFDAIKNLFKAGVNAASEHYKALAAINDLNLLLMAPAVLKDKVIVIDDIERKHENLGIDEVLGFIDEYSKRYGVKFVLILNDDQLSSKGDQEKLWSTFREKVIDREIRLTTSPEEAFSIAISLAPSKYSESLKKASISCDLTNIRIIVKIIKAANQILSDRDLEEAIQARVIPSIVLFSAIHYRGLEDGPDFNFALNAGNFDWIRYARDQDAEPTLEEKRQECWQMLLQELGIHACDEFEKRLVEFLDSGLFDVASIVTIIERYVTEIEAMKAREAAQTFLTRAFWDHRVEEAQLVAEAAALPPIAGLLPPLVATELDGVLAKMDGGAPVGQAIIDSWITAFKAGDPSFVDDDTFHTNPLHPDIQAEFAALKDSAQANATVLDACMYIINNNAWGAFQRVTMSQATAYDFESVIRTIDDQVIFRRFMRRMIDMRLHRATYDPHFGTATERFVEACRNIVNDKSSPRLAGLIHRLFESTSLMPELAPKLNTDAEEVGP